MIVRVLLIYSSDFNVCTDRLGYVLICQVREKKKCSFENAHVEKSEISTRNKKRISRRIVII